MRYSAIKPVDIADGIGCRVGFYVSGCDRHCPGCHNQEAQNFSHGELYTTNTYVELCKLLSPQYIQGLSILGGEPLHPVNQQEVTWLCDAVKACMPGKTIWVYTGYDWEEVKHLEVMRHIDVLVDGEYIQEQRDISLSYRGSRNQRIIDVQQSLKAGSVVLWSDPWDGVSMKTCK